MKIKTLFIATISVVLTTITSCGSLEIKTRTINDCFTDTSVSSIRTYTSYFNTSISVNICTNYDNAELNNIFTSVENTINYYDMISSKRVDYEDIVNIKTINDNPTKKHYISDELFELLEYSIYMYEETNYLFNIALDPVVSIWEELLGHSEFISGTLSLPEEITINDALAKTNASQIVLNTNDKSVTMLDSMSLNLGGIAKGFMVDKLAELLEKTEGVLSYMINAGGSSIKVYGNNPHAERDYWTIQVLNPIENDMLTICFPSINDKCYIETVKLENDETISTSGDYQKYFIADDGNKYHHIIDPNTGYPVVTDVKSVTIISKSEIGADLLSTAIFIMELSDAIEYVNNNDDIEAIWFLSDETIIESSNFSSYKLN